MSTYEFKLPDIGEGVTEGEIVKWLIARGDTVKEDQPIVEVMTDKATVVITAPHAGKVLETRGEAGGVVPVHAVLVVFDLGGAGRDEAHPQTPGAEAAPHTSAHPTHKPPPPAGNAEPAATAVGDIRETLPGMDFSNEAAPAAVNGHAHRGYFNEKPLATPATRALARELGVDLRGVQPTGPNGRVTKDDLRAHGAEKAAPASPGGASSPATEAPVAVRAPRTVPAAETTPRPAPAAPLATRTVEALSPVTTRQAGKLAIPTAQGPSSALEERIPLRGVRKRIFEGMTRSKHTAAHFTFVEECDAGAIIALRARLRPAADKAGVKLTFLPFFVKAVVAALKRHPSLNAAFDESTQEIVVRRFYDIGIASATEAGLVVPVVRGADRKSILDIARDIQRLGDDTKAGKIRPEDLGGSTFTITSLGQQGGLFATPILNFPEVAILGVHQIKQKPVVRDGEIVIGDVMLLSLSFDHRLIDGHVGAAFAYEIIGYLQDPDRLFLEMA
jgi:pyruvate dehydrogenase E2 component (dihydrolipoamide acetyltransferase)